MPAWARGAREDRESSVGGGGGSGEDGRRRGKEGRVRGEGEDTLGSAILERALFFLATVRKIKSVARIQAAFAAGGGGGNGREAVVRSGDGVVGVGAQDVIALVGKEAWGEAVRWAQVCACVCVRARVCVDFFQSLPMHACIHI